MARCLEPSVADQVVRGTLSEDALPAALAHAARCARCRQLLRDAARPGEASSVLPDRELDQVQERLGLWRAARRSALAGAPLRKGDPIDRYVVIRAVGPSEDGMIYEGYDPDREQRVVIKLLDLPSDDPAATALLATARRLIRFSHPNVLPLLSAGGHGGHVYLVYEFIKGTPLAQHSGGDARTVLGWFAQAGRALEAVHALGLAHGAFSAASCLVDRQGRVRVLDFGVTEARIQHLAQVSAHLEEDWPAPSEPLRVEDSFIGFVPTRRAPTAPFESFILAAAPATLGTRQFAAPEVVHGAPPSAAADQFAFCAALYHHLARRSPFGGESISLWLRDVLRGHSAAPPDVPGVSRGVWAALARGMSAQPAARFARMTALLARLPGDGPLSRPRARVAVALAVGAAAIAGVVVARHGRGAAAASGCDRASTRQWQALAQREQGLGSALGAVAPQARQKLAGWLQDWRGQSGEFCALPATRGASGAAAVPSQQAALARSCELAARDAFAEVMQLLSTAPREALDRSAAAIEVLPRVADCARAPRRAAPPAVVTRAEVRRRLGLLREASEIIDGAPQGETLPELSVVRARVALDRGDLAEARRDLELAAFAAQAAGDPATGLTAAVERLALACSSAERTLWHGLVQAQTAQHPEAAPAPSELQAAQAAALACEGDVPAAARLVEAVARAYEGRASGPAAAAALASARLRLAQGDLVGAQAAAQRAVSAYQAAYGERHPAALMAQLTVAEAQLAGAGWPSAEPLIDQVAAATEADAVARQEADEVRARAWLLRARLVARRARASAGADPAARARGAVRSIEPLRKAVAEYEAALGGAHPALAAATLELGDALLDAGRDEEAEASYRQTAAIFESLGQGGSPQLAHARIGVALARWGQRPPADAQELMRWGAAPLGGELDPGVEAWAEAALARRLAVRGEHARAERSYRRAWAAAEAVGTRSPVMAQLAPEVASFAEQRELPDAAELLERALAFTPPASAERAPLAAALARLLWTSDRQRATSLVDAAVTGYGAGSQEAEALLRWTRRQGRR